MAVLEKIEDRYLVRVDELITKGNQLPPTPTDSDWFEVQPFTQWKVSVMSLLSNLPIVKNYYEQEFKDNVQAPQLHDLDMGLGILKSLKEDMGKGILQKGIELAKAEVFTDFLDMADHLLEKGYKDPAASLIGAVLEIELKNLCVRNEIKVKDNDEISCINGKLKDKEVYHQPMRSQIEAWKKIRDKADHGEFQEYSIGQVKDFLSGVRKFIGEYLG